MTAAVARAVRTAPILVLLLFVAGRLLVPVDETDLFFNLRLGEIILDDHVVPRTNLLSFTYPDHRDVNLAWLFQIVLALAHRAGGVPGTLLLKTAFVLGTIAVLFRVALRRGATAAAAVPALALSAWAAEPRFVERPHLVTFLGLALTLLALERAESREESASSARRVSSREGPGTLTGFPVKSLRPRALYALVPCGLVWANANSCFFLAPLVLALYALGARLDGRPADARRAVICAGALVPLIFATPSGVHALGYIANHWRMPGLRPLQEYVPARWPDNAPAAFVAVGVVVSAILPGRRWRHLLPVALLGLAGARRNRFLAEFVLLSAPIVACALTDAAARATARMTPLLRVELGRIAAVGVVALFAGAAIVPRVNAVRRGERAFDVGLDPTLVPMAAIAFVNLNGLRDHMYNDMEVGSYLTWEGWPRHRVFQDPRINGYPPAFHALLRRDDLSGTEWDALLAGFGVSTALLTYPAENPRAAFFDPERWALVYRADDGLVFVRREEFDRMAGKMEIPVTFAFDRATGVQPRALDVQPAKSWMQEGEWRKRLGDFFVETHDDRRAASAYREAISQSYCCLESASMEAARVGLGDAALRLGDPETAVEAYRDADLPRAHVNRALALLALGRPQEALKEADGVLAADPDNADARAAQRLARERLPPPPGP